jgi:hypothetical protein
MRPYVQYGLSEAQRLYQAGAPEFYTGQTYVGPSQQTQAALSAMQTRAMQGNPLVPLAQQQLATTLTGTQAQGLGQTISPYLAQTLSGQQAEALGASISPYLSQTLSGQQAEALGASISPYLSQTLSGQQAQALGSAASPELAKAISGAYLGANPYYSSALQPGFQAATTAYQDAINQMRSRASQAGRYGTNEALMSQEQRAQGALANALTGQAAQLGYSGYEAERARQQQALGLGLNLYESEKARQQAAAQTGAQLYESEKARQQAAAQTGAQLYEAERARQQAAAQTGAQLYSQERGFQQAAIGAAPGLAAQDYTDIAQLAQAGQAAESYQQAALQDAIQRFNYQQQAPYAALQSFLSSSFGAPQGMQTVAPSYSNPLAGVLGAALAGKALLS